MPKLLILNLCLLIHCGVMELLAVKQDPNVGGGLSTVRELVACQAE